jgi:hypothetical protein
MEAIKDILLVLLQAVIVTAVPILAKFLIDLLKNKSAQLQDRTTNAYIDNIIMRVTDVVTNTVMFVSQTYVDNLKKEGKFDVEEQKIAFEMAYDRVMDMVDEESEIILTGIFGDFGLWVNTLIEAIVKIQKA